VNAASLSAAGVLPYTTYNPYNNQKSTVWVMLSRELYGKDKGCWDMFNGDIDGQETPKMAAAREAEEESCTLIGKKEEIIKKIKSIDGSQNYFFMELFNPMSYNNQKFLKIKAAHWKKHKNKHYQEKGEILWVKLSQLNEACTHNNGILVIDGKFLKIRPYLKKFVIKHKAYLQAFAKK
jgi:hypothetical protein